jgi:hypothetical protein
MGERLPEFMLVPEPIKLPATARIHHVFTDHPLRTICVVVEDDSFDDQPDGRPLPWAEETLIWGRRSVRLIKDDALDLHAMDEKTLLGLKTAVDERLYDLARGK